MRNKERNTLTAQNRIVSAYQIGNKALDLDLGLRHLVFPAHDHDDVLVGVASHREHDARSRPLAHLADVGAAAANEELVVLGLGLHLGRVARVFALLRQLQQLLARALHVVLRSADCDAVAGGASGREADDDATTLLHHRANEPAFSTND